MNKGSRFRGAVLKEQGVTFAVVLVRSDVVEGPAGQAEEARAAFGLLFPGMPVVLMCRDQGGRASYHGRRDIARFLSTVRERAINWIDYSVG